MSNSTTRWAVLKETSNDKGPYKMAGFDTDGAPRDFKIVESYGVEASPEAGSMALVHCPDGDEGRGTVTVMPAPAKRLDGQKPGEVAYRCPMTGNMMKHDADGHTSITTPSGSITKMHKDGTIGVQPGAGQKVYLGDVAGAGCVAVLTVAGPSSNVFAKV